MTKYAFVALAFGVLMPAPASAARVIVAAEGRDASTRDFSVSMLIEGVDHVLASVDDHPPVVADPFGSGAPAFAAGNGAVRPAATMTYRMTSYGSADSVREPLPEPATWLMMILGFFGLSFAVRRRSVVTGDRVRFS